MADETPGWEFEPRDDKSALLDRLRTLERHAREDGEWIKASDLDAVVNAALEGPRD